MKLTTLLFIILFLTLPCLAQECRFPPSNNCRTQGKANVIYTENPKATQASILVYLIGKPEDITPNKYAGYDIKNDILTLYVSYYAYENIVPDEFRILLGHSFTVSSKYKDKQKLVIYVNDKQVLSKELEKSDDFSLYIRYTDFRQLIEAKKITIEFGEAKVELKPEAIEALNDLYKTTELLNPRPMYDPRMRR
jgi:hypothetical protein